MQSLVNFQGNKVEMLRLGDSAYFNPYDVGRCLGLCDSAVRMAMSKMSDKQVVLLKNSDVNIFDIRKLNNAGERFLTESGVYKLAFKSNKPNAEQFADWVADEVLPSIRKTGAYSVKPQNKPAPVEELTTKYYKGQPVVTISDIALVSGKSPFEIRYHVNNALIRGTDYYFLTGNELDKFKDENKSISRMASSLIVINKQGFIKLVKVMQGIPQLPCFKNALPEPKQVPDWKQPCVDIPENPKAQKMFEAIKNKITALSELIEQANMYVHENEHKAICRVIDSLSMRLCVECTEIKRIPYKLIERPL